AASSAIKGKTARVLDALRRKEPAEGARARAGLLEKAGSKIAGGGTRQRKAIIRVRSNSWADECGYPGCASNREGGAQLGGDCRLHARRPDGPPRTQVQARHVVGKYLRMGDRPHYATSGFLVRKRGGPGVQGLLGAVQFAAPLEAREPGEER